jgi:predicted acylesterase/phospholipase RssA
MSASGPSPAAQPALEKPQSAPVCVPSGFVPRFKHVCSCETAEFRQQARKSWHRHPICLVLVLWITVCFLVEAPSAFAKIAALLLATVYVLHHTAHKLRHFNWLITSLVLLPGLLIIAGSYNYPLDLAFIVAGLVPSSIVFYRQMHRGKLLLQTRLLLLALGSTWLLWSAGDAVFERKPEPVDPSRFAGLQKNSRYPKARVGLALSGGGYRAGILHAGVLSGLEAAHIRVTNVSSVSGGSIIAGYYVRGGAPADFLRAATSGHLNLYRELLDAQNALRLPFPARIPGTTVKLLPFYEFSTTEAQAGLLDRRLLSHATLADVPADAPQLMICATDLNSARAVGVTRGWMLERFVLTPVGEEIFSNAVKLFTQSGVRRVEQSSWFMPTDSSSAPMAPLVAGSGAVPFAFVPVLFHKLALADGAITDNSGMTLLLDAHRRATLNDPKEGDPDWRLDVAIAADAGQLFADDVSDGGSSSRALNIMFHRAGLRRLREQRGSKDAPPQLLLSPSLYVDNSVGGEVSRQQKRLSQLVAQQIVSIDTASLDVLAQIANRLPEKTRSEVQVAVTTLKNLPKPHPGDKTAEGSQRLRLDAVNTLINHLAPDFVRCLDTFLKIGTLANSVSRSDAEDLFRLGQYLVVLNAPEVDQALAPLVAPENRLGPALTEVERQEVMRRWKQDQGPAQ